MCTFDTLVECPLLRKEVTAHGSTGQVDATPTHVSCFHCLMCARELGVSHLSKTYLKAMKAKASGRVQTRSRGWGKMLRSSSVFMSRQCISGGSQKSSRHSHSFNTASILREQRQDGGERDAGPLLLLIHWCFIQISVGQQLRLAMEDTQWPVSCCPHSKWWNSSRRSRWKKRITK